MKIKSKLCPVCKTTVEVEVEESSYNAWRRGMLIQHAFPHLNLDTRERFITGLHGDCWGQFLGVPNPEGE